MKSGLSTFLKLSFLSFFSTFVIWALFYFKAGNIFGVPLPKNGMATIVANYDGPLYIVVAKTLYEKVPIQNFSINLPSEYYAAHFPMYPILIRAFSIIFGYPYSMLFVTLVSSFLATCAFYGLALYFLKNPSKAMFLTFVFSYLPARWVAVKAVGSPEPLFEAAIIGSVLFFLKKKYLLSAVLGSVAQLTKSPGILLFIAIFLMIAQPTLKSVSSASYKTFNFRELVKYLPMLLIPLSLLSVFILYYITTGDFLAYFHSGDNIHLFFPPFQIFNYSQPWVNTPWLEEIIFVYAIGATGLIELIKQKKYELAWFVGVFFVTTLFVSHRDLIRYSLPIYPFVLVAFADYLLKKEFRMVMAILLIPIFLFSLAFISNNVMPISDWAPFL